MADQTASGASGPSFAQQGSVDWVALSGSTMSFSIEVLSRFSRAGVEMITIAIGQAMCLPFNIPAAGQQRLSDALARLKAFSSYGKVLWFGFGVKSVVRTLCETEQGAALTAICACLSVSYDTLFASQVLRALAQASSAPEQLKPSLSQWGALINVCAGSVTGSKFPILVQGFASIFDVKDRNSRPLALHEATDVLTLATALLEIARVSSGHIHSITIEGGVDCGWLAAIAEWLLDLRVSISDCNGSLLYLTTSSGTESPPQIIFIRPSTQQRGHQIRLRSRAYHIPQGALCFQVNRDDGSGSSMSQHFFSKGRSEWATILHDTFGSSLDPLINPQNIPRLGRFLCSGLPRLSDDSLDCLNPWGETNFADDIEIRRDFLSFAAERLPELQGLHLLLQDQSYKAFGLPEGHWFSPHIKPLCPCKTCRENSQPEAGDPAICLEKIAITIFEFLWVLSRLDIAEGLNPSSSGLAMLYHNPENSFNGNRIAPFMIRHDVRQRGMNKMLFSLFSGLSYAGQENSTGISAICGGGICMYLPVLQHPALPPNRQFRIRILPGIIERQGTIYQQVSDMPQDRGQKFVPLPAAPSTFVGKFGPKPELQLVVEETLNSNLLYAKFLAFSTESQSRQLSLSRPEDVRRNGSSTADSAVVTSIGPYSMIQKLQKRIKFCRCTGKQVGIFSDHNPEVTPQSFWNGTCRDAEQGLQTTFGLQASIFPSKQEWILVQVRDKEVEILRGDISLLHFVIWFAERATSDAKEIFLTRRQDCFLCTGIEGALVHKEKGLGLFRKTSVKMTVATQLRKMAYVVHNFLLEREEISRLFDVLQVQDEGPFVEDEMRAVPHIRPAQDMR